jgi:hypothetical protein
VKHFARWLLLAVLISGCGSNPSAEPAPASLPFDSSTIPCEPLECGLECSSGCPAPRIALTATLTVEGDTVLVSGTSNLPDGAVLVWELSRSIVDSEVPVDSEESVWVSAGIATVHSGAYEFTVSWGEKFSCGDTRPLELWVSYYPLADVAQRGALPAQPDSLYELHGERGELITGAVSPAELVEMLSPPGSQRVERVVTCP